MPGCGHVLGVLSCPCGPWGQLISQPSGPDTPADLIWGGSSEASGGKRDALPTPIFPEACTSQCQAQHGSLSLVPTPFLAPLLLTLLLTDVAL